MSICIRPVTSLDDTLAAQLARLVPQLAPAAAVPTAEALRRVAAGPSTVLFVAFGGERAVGMLTLAWYDTPTGRKAWIEDVVVDASARGCGAGEALVREAVAHAARCGAGRVTLTSSPRREAARALYRKMGFEAVETTVFARKTES
ncbi:GNAT family N-acetyltransferase [Alistipes sp.]|uniref:GNAT family N-acetyltransferase n=1 Tax=Alistipes sp. TaxID=1872444 RepID=UPI003AEF897A